MENTKNLVKRLSDLKKGDYFKFIGRKKVYEYNGKSRGRYSKYLYTSVDDYLSGGYETKTNREIETDFEY